MQPTARGAAQRYLLLLLLRLPLSRQAALGDGGPRRDVLGDGHQLLALEVHGLPVPGDRFGAAPDELQGGQPACGNREALRRSRKGAGPREGAPCPPRPRTHPAATAQRRSAPPSLPRARRALWGGGALVVRTRWGAVSPAPSGASRLLATGALRPVCGSRCSGPGPLPTRPGAAPAPPGFLAFLFPSVPAPHLFFSYSCLSLSAWRLFPSERGHVCPSSPPYPPICTAQGPKEGAGTLLTSTHRGWGGGGSVWG